jgi:hypothetical protein
MIRKAWCVVLALAACAALVSNAIAAPISFGNLVVVQVGDGSGALAAAATPTFLKEFTKAGAPVQSIAMPTTVAGSGNRALTNTGNATSEGFIAQSVDGDFLVLGGYNAAVGTLNPQTATPGTINRVVGRVTIGSGAVDTTTALTDAFDGSNIRSATAIDGNKIYVGGNAGSGLGATGGVRFTTFGSTTSTRVNTGANSGSNSRVVELFGPSALQLYASASSTPRLAVQQIGTGTPMVAGAAETTLPGMPTTGSHSTYDFWFRDANTVYLADDGTAANGGGIQKWVLSSGTWSLAYTLLNTGSATTAVRGLTGQVIAGNTVLWATTGASLITVTDTGSGATATTLATAPTNTAFRGVEYINVPEPATLALVVLGGLAALGMLRKRV